MKTYGNGMKATEISKKQVNVIWAKAKAGELKVEKWIMKDFYDIADFYGYDYNGSVASDESTLKKIIDKMFAGALSEAQTMIDEYTTRTWELSGNKRRAAADRKLVA